MTRVLDPIPIFAGEPPEHTGGDREEQEWKIPGPVPVTMVRNVVRPTLTPVLPDPDRATRTGVVICPGGGYFMVAVDHEGLDVANWLADNGVAAFVLKYRVMETPRSDEEMMAFLAPSAPGPSEEDGPTTSGEGPGMLNEILRRMNEFAPIPLADGGEAMRLVHAHAGEWGVRTDRIGAVGFSAGGRLVLDLAMNDDPPVRPAFVGAIYPAYPEHAVPTDAPPLFLAVAVDDPLLPGSIQAMRAWQEAGRPVEGHFYGRGGHGFGLHEQGVPADGWIGQFRQWIGSEGFLG